ncbi:MAG TPA: pilus assembly protein TadG-related protein [Candidatus Binatia bacterium]
MENKKVACNDKWKNQRGGVLAYTVLSALALFLAVGLGVDLAHLYTVKTELQNAADSAALAGASALDLPADAKIPESADRAVQILNNNKYNFNNKTFVSGTPDLATLRTQLRPYLRYAVNLSEFDNGGMGKTYEEAEADPDDIRFIQVITPNAPVDIYFALPILGGQRNLTARAVAGYSVPGNTEFCIFPLSAVSCDPGDANCKLECRKTDDPSTPEIDESEPGCKCDPSAADYPQPECTKYYGECPNNANYAPIPVADGGLDPDGDGFCDPKREFCKGCTYTVRSEPAKGPAAGSYNILKCGDGGKCETRMALAAYGSCDCKASAGDPLSTDNEPGQAAGPVRQGINVRFDTYNGCDPATDPTCDPGCQPNPTDHPPDSNIAEPINYGQYSANPPNPFLAPPDHPPGVAQRRVVVMPIVPLGEYTDGNGRQVVHPSGFAGFFIQKRVPNGSGDIKIEYMAEDIVDVIGFDPNSTNVTNVVTPVLYR